LDVLVVVTREKIFCLQYTKVNTRRLQLRPRLEIVGRLSADFPQNRSLCDKSMKFGTKAHKGGLIRFRTVGAQNLAPGGHVGHFSKWLPNMDFLMRK